VGAWTIRAFDLGYRFPYRMKLFHSFYTLSLCPDKYLEIEAIYIPLPDSLDAQWTIKALNAGKHMLCEKPLAITTRDGTSMIRAAHDNRVFLMEGFMYHFHPQSFWVLEQIYSGCIGKVRLVHLLFSFDVRPHPHDIR
jgi:xylose dehydrogenase (NAD/NADP)